MQGEPKNERPFTRRVKDALANARRRKNVNDVVHTIACPPPPRQVPEPTRPAVRTQAKKIAWLLINHEPQVHYEQQRPMQTDLIRTITALKKTLSSPGGVTMDCSESVTLIARLAGAPNPNGNQPKGEGNTATMLANCRQISAAAALPGDLVVFGDGGGHHVCMILEPDPDPLLFSHGQERGPIAIRLSVERRFQPAPVRFLRYI